MQETWVRAFAEDPGAFERPRLVQILTDLAAGGEYSIEVRPAEAAAGVEGFDADADTAELFLPGLLHRRPRHRRVDRPSQWLAWCAPDT